MSTFCIFFQKCNFFHPKKGPRTGLTHSLTQLRAIQFSDHAKSKAQITERIFNEAPPRCRSQKSIIFRRTHEMDISFSSGWIERFAQILFNKCKKYNKSNDFQNFEINFLVKFKASWFVFNRVYWF